MTSGNLRLLVAALRVPDNYADLRSFLRLPPQHRWSEHQAILAATLGSTEWYAVAEAYESLDLLRAASSRNELFVEDGRRVFHTVITEWFEELATKVQSGADALSRLAGGAPVRPPEGMTVRDAITSLVQDPGEAPSVHEADKPASQ